MAKYSSYSQIIKAGKQAWAEAKAKVRQSGLLDKVMKAISIYKSLLPKEVTEAEQTAEPTPEIKTYQRVKKQIERAAKQSSPKSEKTEEPVQENRVLEWKKKYLQEHDMIPLKAGERAMLGFGEKYTLDKGESKVYMCNADGKSYRVYRVKKGNSSTVYYKVLWSGAVPFGNKGHNGIDQADYGKKSKYSGEIVAKSFCGELTQELVDEIKEHMPKNDYESLLKADVDRYGREQFTTIVDRKGHDGIYGKEYKDKDGFNVQVILRPGVEKTDGLVRDWHNYVKVLAKGSIPPGGSRFDFQFLYYVQEPVTLGGWISSTSNLANNGKAWVGDNAVVCGHARVSGNATVTGNSEVSGNAKVSGFAQVGGNSTVSHNAHISGEARVDSDKYHIHIKGAVKVFGIVEGEVKLEDFVEIKKKGKVKDNATVKGHAVVYGTVGGTAVVSGASVIKGEVNSGEVKDCVIVNAMAKVNGDAVLTEAAIVDGTVDGGEVSGATFVGEGASVKDATIDGACEVGGELKSAEVIGTANIPEGGSVSGGEVYGAIYAGGEFQGRAYGTVNTKGQVGSVTVTGNLNATASASGGTVTGNCVVDEGGKSPSGGNEVISVKQKMKEAGIGG